MSSSNISRPVSVILADPHKVDLAAETFADTRTQAKVIAKSVRLDEEGVVSAIHRTNAQAEEANRLQNLRANLALHC